MDKRKFDASWKCEGSVGYKERCRPSKAMRGCRCAHGIAGHQRGEVWTKHYSTRHSGKSRSTDLGHSWWKEGGATTLLARLQGNVHRIEVCNELGPKRKIGWMRKESTIQFNTRAQATVTIGLNPMVHP
eukprot:1157308-Pelagomonas_calceolata.AAC.6